MQMWAQTSKILCYHFNSGLVKSSSSLFIVILHARTWKEGRNPKDTGRGDPKRFPSRTTVATANRCCRKYGTACATCRNRQTHLKWTLVHKGRCSKRIQGNWGAATTPKTLTTKPYRRSARPSCLLKMSPTLQACSENPVLQGSRRWGMFLDIVRGCFEWLWRYGVLCMSL